ncbi:LysR substrate-binding domain-containing protein [Pigmentiphaga kullae]|uniref:LysR family transcriptional regulator of gallate degradation n=1 Tax=Pigmentiphaga kullae TaxID=151784 RepID=A0A4Q7NKS7_9BURK|nr:LysR substrate-binding domain-containing protein [Pigmentiphaga kullae]RZS85538.1 LysR family transcriptional regulator of gallate degradation [Pigmentiphaga kullae]
MLHTKHLRPFLAVVRHGNLARASEELRRAQSAVSRSVQELEGWFGVALFERSARQWLLTDFGQTLHRRTELAFTELQQACDALCERYPESAQRLRTAPFFSLAVHERRLELLFAFTERKHISTAAAAVGVSQPAASMALYDLEASVGVPLFDRAHAGVALNDSGELLLAHVKRALAQLRLAGTEISALKGVIEGQVVVGALPFSRPYVLPVAVGRVLAQHPRLQVRTLEAPMDTLVAGLRLGDVDFLVGALPVEPLESALVVEQLMREPMVVLARRDHPLATAAAPDLADLMESAWVLPRQGTPTREALGACLAQHGLPEPQVAVESSDISLIRGLLLETDMLSAASRQLFPHELRAGILVELPVVLAGTERSMGILRRTQEHSSPGAQLLIEAIRRVCRDESGAKDQRSAAARP